MNHKDKTFRNYLRKCKRSHRRKNFLSIMFLVVGAVILCGFLAIIQNISATRSQEKSSAKILEEVQLTLSNNDEVVKSVFLEYNEINQTTISTLTQYIGYIDVLEPLKTAGDNINQEIQKVSGELKDICNNLSINDMLIINKDGRVVLGSNPTYIGANIKSALSEEQVNNLIGYEASEDGVTRNGTYHFVDNEKKYTPVLATYDDTEVYLYSTYFGKSGGIDYYVLTYVPSSVIEEELKNIKSIESVLSGITVGKTGFLFAIDSNEKTFKYFDDGKNVLTNSNYLDYGLKQEAAEGNYSGYQTVLGTRYYCVTRSFQSETYGEFTVIAAVVSQTELVQKNILTITFSCVGFVLVACIVAGYGLILRRDIVEHILGLEEKFKLDLQDENGHNKFTEEEISERTRILIEEEIDKNKDKKLRRKNIGVRNSKGHQAYFSNYIFNRLLSVITIGLVAVFFISFFSQTLLGLNDATNVSKIRLDEIVSTIEKNEDNKHVIQDYVDNQFLSKAKLVSYLLEETPEIIYENVNDKNVHTMIEKDEKNNSIPIEHNDYPGVNKVSLSNSFALQEICNNNGIKSIYVFDDSGRVMATNTDFWYFMISNNPEDESYIFNQILDDHTHHIIQETQTDEITGAMDQYIGTEFYYYTYLDGSDVRLASKTNYEEYVKTGSWNRKLKDADGNMVTTTLTSQIKQHRSLLQICVDISAIEVLFGTSSIEYILDNMYVYGESSFFVAFDKSEDHNVIYSPYEVMIGKSAASIGIKPSAFTISGSYNGFQSINGVEYYQSFELVGDYYIATAIPTSTIYETRNRISGYTLLVSAIFIVLSSAVFTVSTDRADKNYCNAIKYSGDMVLTGASSSFEISTPSGKRRKTSSVVSRFTKVSWRRKSPEEKLSTILMIYMTVFSIAILGILIYAINRRSDDSIFGYIFSGVWEKGFNIFAITEALMIMIIIITVTKLAQIAVRSFCGSLGARVETTGNLVVSVLKYGGVICGVFYCLYLFGFDTASLLTSAGILSIVIGLGAQSLISDIIAGIFIVFEGAFRVGDIVTIGDFRGQVLEIGLRTTKIEDISKNIKIFNNSSISGVLNMTKEASFASVTVSIEYGESLERVEKVLRDAFPKIRRRNPSIIDGPFYKGVKELGESSVDLLIIAQCQEKDRIQLSRDLNREIFVLFGKNNINIPFPQVTLSRLENKEQETTKQDRKEAYEFIKDQKLASKDKETE